MEENLRRIHRSVVRVVLTELLSVCCQEIRFLTKCLIVVLRFYQNLQSALPEEQVQNRQVPPSPISQEAQRPPQRLENKNGESAEVQEERNTTSVYQRRRKREKHNEKDCCLDDASCSAPELENFLDLFTWRLPRRKAAWQQQLFTRKNVLWFIHILMQTNWNVHHHVWRKLENMLCGLCLVWSANHCVNVCTFVEPCATLSRSICIGDLVLKQPVEGNI